MLFYLNQQVAINERRHLCEKQIQKVHLELARAKAESAERLKQQELEKFQGL